MDKFPYEDLAVQLHGQAFVDKVKAISRLMGVNPGWLLTVMKLESGLNPKAFNPLGGATGLIQFMPQTAIALGTTTEALSKMSGLVQLDYVKKYFINSGILPKVKSFVDLYTLTFYPVAVGKTDEYKFPPIVVKYNSALDINGDGTLTMSEWKNAIANRISSQAIVDVLEIFKKKVA